MVGQGQEVVGLVVMVGQGQEVVGLVVMAVLGVLLAMAVLGLLLAMVVGMVEVVDMGCTGLVVVVQWVLQQFDYGDYLGLLVFLISNPFFTATILSKVLSI